MRSAQAMVESAGAARSASRECVLLLNPPGSQLYLRDNYCSTASKAGFCWQPTDLLVQSGILAQRFDVDLVDAIIDPRSPAEVLDLVQEKRYRAILSMTAAGSWREDFALLERIKSAMPDTTIAVSGDIGLFEYERLFKAHPCLDVVLLNYTTDDLCRFLLGERDGLKKLVHRSRDGTLCVHDERPSPEFSYPLPLHEKAVNDRYYSPLATRHPSTVVISSFGCPHRCTFCIASEINYSFRNVDNLLGELRWVSSLGFKEVFFTDFMFEVKRSRVLEICRRMVEEQLDLTWFCSCRLDTVDPEMLKAMRAAGCHTVLFGVESTKQDVLDKTLKRLKLEQVRLTIRACEEAGIRPFCNFVLGLPGETRESLLAIGRFAVETGCYNAVFSTFVPAVGTDLRKKLVERGEIASEVEMLTTTGKHFQVPQGGMSQAEMEALRRRVMLRFYLHPRVLLRNVANLRSPYELRKNLRSLKELLKVILT